MIIQLFIDEVLIHEQDYKYPKEGATELKRLYASLLKAPWYIVALAQSKMNHKDFRIDPIKLRQEELKKAS